MSQLMAGAGSARIQYSDRIFPLEGFQGIHDDPSVRILILCDDDSAAVLSMEQVMLSKDEISHIQERVSKICHVTPDHVFLHLTHAITTPHNPMAFSPQSRPEDAEEKGALCSQAVLDAVCSAAAQAAATMKNARIGSANGFSAANCNRDENTESGWWIGAGGMEIANQKMSLIRIADEAGAPIATIINYALKPCAVDNAGMDSNDRLISSDVAGYACRMMEDRYQVPCLYLMSAAANQVPRETAVYDEVQPDGSVVTIDKGVDYGFRLVEKIGQEMGEDAIAIAESVSEYTDQSGICVKHETFPWHCMGKIEKRPVLEMEYPVEKQTREVDVWTLTVGTYAFVFGKAEMNPDTQYQLLGVSPCPNTYLVTMTNGGCKYMPDAQAYDDFTWEAQSALVSKGAAEQFVATAVSMLS